jgi:GT2 family glycosyltransferase
MAAYLSQIWSRIRYRLGEPRTLREIATIGRQAVRLYGWQGAFNRLRQYGEIPDSNASYASWCERHTPNESAFAAMAAEAGRLAHQPLISVIMPVWNTDSRWLDAAVESVRRQVYTRWELCIADDASDVPATLDSLRGLDGDPRIRITRLDRNSGISAASNAALSTATGDFIILLDHDDELTPDALFRMVSLLNEDRAADLIYSDEDKLDLEGRRCDPFFKPDWSPELLLSYMYTCHATMIRRAVVQRAGGFRIGYEGAQDYDLTLRVARETSRIRHVPHILYHWRKVPGSAAAEVNAKPWALEKARKALEDDVAARTLDATVLPGDAPGLFRVKFHVRNRPLVTIVVPTDDRSRNVAGRMVQLLPNCLRSIVDKTDYANYEILVVDNGVMSSSTESFLAKVPHRRVTYTADGPFNFARKLNFSVRHANGSQLVILNDDVEVSVPEWLAAMLEHSQRPEIGAVGAKLFFPDGRLQHVGLLIGVCGVAAHAFHTQPGQSAGYGNSAIVVRNYSAVTGACMMTRRQVFEKVGGFNERLLVDFNDVDYCLRVRQGGFRVVYTPYAQLVHFEAGTIGRTTQSPAELAEMRRLWGPTLLRDPYYNPNLTTEYADYRLGD